MTRHHRFVIENLPEKGTASECHGSCPTSDHNFSLIGSSNINALRVEKQRLGGVQRLKGVRESVIDSSSASGLRVRANMWPLLKVVLMCTDTERPVDASDASSLQDENCGAGTRDSESAREVSGAEIRRH